MQRRGGCRCPVTNMTNRRYITLKTVGEESISYFEDSEKAVHPSWDQNRALTDAKAGQFIRHWEESRQFLGGKHCPWLS